LKFLFPLSLTFGAALVTGMKTGEGGGAAEEKSGRGAAMGQAIKAEMRGRRDGRLVGEHKEGREAETSDICEDNGDMIEE
jgi:hypothetical protein